MMQFLTHEWMQYMMQHMPKTKDLQNIKTPFEIMLEPCDAYTKRAQKQTNNWNRILLRETQLEVGPNV